MNSIVVVSAAYTYPAQSGGDIRLGRALSAFLNSRIYIPVRAAQWSQTGGGYYIWLQKMSLKEHCLDSVFYWIKYK
jgi:hypothetical protein